MLRAFAFLYVSLRWDVIRPFIRQQVSVILHHILDPLQSCPLIHCNLYLIMTHIRLQLQISRCIQYIVAKVTAIAFRESCIQTFAIIASHPSVSIYLSINQSINQSTNQSTNQSIYLSIYQLMN
ncbi:hypothetical protein BGX38DRAFT_803233 [Terfezia claveryi]|nr:hypothetical protein BGX38DRAFT_803233 [Terfezia claveryi]